MQRSEILQPMEIRPQSAAFNKPSLAWLLASQDQQLAICRELEDIADSLPSSMDRQRCMLAARALLTTLKTAHDYEEQVFYPALRRDGTGDETLEPIFTRLKFEHCEDECYAEELADALMKLGRGEQVNVEATGYMLRGFFEARRRHIAFERDHLLKYLRP